MLSRIMIAMCCLACAACPASAGPRAVLSTDRGEIELELDEVRAPLSTANFKAYCQEGYYGGTIFHRVIPTFMIQGGGLTADLRDKPARRPPIKNEAANGLSNKRGTVAMARTNVVDSATAQFFINVVDNQRLDHRAPTPDAFGYAVFGRVTRGMEVVDAIRAVPTRTVGMHANVPVEAVTITACRWLGP